MMDVTTQGIFASFLWPDFHLNGFFFIIYTNWLEKLCTQVQTVKCKKNDEKFIHYSIFKWFKTRKHYIKNVWNISEISIYVQNIVLSTSQYSQKNVDYTTFSEFVWANNIQNYRLDIDLILLGVISNI